LLKGHEKLVYTNLLTELLLPHAIADVLMLADFLSAIFERDEIDVARLWQH
jgi:hypothetical protein